ncbi:MAG: nucleotidyltransferase [Deltaproteobacteria bacterium]|nr:nucleotidyltransferase [Deltaproteobacteria bacterium]
MRRRPASVELLASLAKVLRAHEIRWYLFGAQAAVLYGSPRMTMDVDVTIAVPPQGIQPLVDALLEAGFDSRAENLGAFLAKTRVLPLFHRRTRMPLDLVIARDALELAFLDRAQRVDIGRLKVPVITVEDLVIAKLFAPRPRDLEDVRAVLATQSATIDLRYVRTLLGQLDEEDRAELLSTLERLLQDPDAE